MLIAKIEEKAGELQEQVKVTQGAGFTSSGRENSAV